MLIGSRQSLWRGGRLSARSYVQEGLIAQWDGIENAGYGRHDPNATTWKDLVEHYDLDITDSARLGSTSLDCNLNGRTLYACRYRNYFNAVAKTIEACVRINGTKGDRDGYTLIQAGRSFQEISIIEDGGQNYSFGFRSSFYDYALDSVTKSRPNTISLSHNSDGSDSVGYLNGKKKGTNSGSFFTFSTPWLSLSGTTYGRAGDMRVAGNFYSVRFYDRFLTEDERLQNFKIDKERFGI